MIKDFTKEFQTPPEVCRYMVSLLPPEVETVLEPTKGIGNIVSALKGFKITAPDDYFLLDKEQRFDAVVMNPPFSRKYGILENAPASYLAHGMQFGYRILVDCMHKADIVVACMPWFTLSDSDVRLRYIKKYGIRKLVVLPRKTFKYARIQTCILHLEKGYKGDTIFIAYDLLPKVEDELLLNQQKLILT